MSENRGCRFILCPANSPFGGRVTLQNPTQPNLICFSNSLNSSSFNVIVQSYLTVSKAKFTSA